MFFVLAAVVALVKKLGASAKLTYLITGESLLNDATALVLYNMFFSRIAIANSRIEFSPQGIGIYFLQIVFISPLIGLAFGLGSVWCIGMLNRRMQKDDTIMQISVSFCCAYLSFFVAELTLGVSGVLSCCSAGVVLAAFAPPLIFEPESMHSVWSTIEWIGNTLIFMLAGLIIGKHCISFFSWTNMAYLLLLYVLLFAVRAVMIGLSRPFLYLIGYDLSANEVAFLTWGGLRGAVSMTLALSLSNSIAGNHTVLDPENSDIVFFFIGGIAAMTLLLNATTCGLLLKWLHLIDDDHSAEKVVMLSYLKARLRWKVDHLISELKTEHSRLFQGEQLQGFCSLISHSLDALDVGVKEEQPVARSAVVPGEEVPERKSDELETSYDFHIHSAFSSPARPAEFKDIEPALQLDHSEIGAPQKKQLRARAERAQTMRDVFSPEICIKIRKVFLQVVHVSYWKQIKVGKLPRHSLAALILLGALDKAAEMKNITTELMDWYIIVKSNSFIFSVDDSVKVSSERHCSMDGATSEVVSGSRADGVQLPTTSRDDSVDGLHTQASRWCDALRRLCTQNQFLRAKRMVNRYLVSQLVHVLLGFIEAHEYAQKKIPLYMGATEEADTLEQVIIVKESQQLGEGLSEYRLVSICVCIEFVC